MRRRIAASILALAACASTPVAPPVAPPSGPRLVATTRGRILVDDGGSGGLPVLFLHGIGADQAAWRECLAHVRSTRRAVALDLPGFGRSDPPRGGDWSAIALGEDVGRVADALGISRFVLVVHGFAGSIGLAYASRHPLRVAGLLFVDAGGGQPDPGGAFASAQREAFSPARWQATVDERQRRLLDGALDATRDRVQAVLDATSREAFLAAALAPAWGSPGPALAKFKGPRFALASPRRVLEGIQADVEGFPYRKVEGASHWIMLDRPDAVIAALDELLAQVK